MTLVHHAVAEAVAVGRGTAIRLHASARSAIAAGLPARLARALFQGAPQQQGNNPCGGACAVASNAASVWCVTAGCDLTRCECRMREMFKDANGKWQDEDRGTPDAGSPLPLKKGSFYRCICKPKLQQPKKKPKKKPSKKTSKPQTLKKHPKKKKHPSKKTTGPHRPHRPRPKPAPRPRPTPEPSDNPT